MRPTTKQLELLQVLNPYKEIKVTYDMAAGILGISINGVKGRMRRLKKRCPDVYWKFNQLRKDMAAGQRAVKYPIVMNPRQINKLYGFNKIREQF